MFHIFNSIFWVQFYSPGASIIVGLHYHHVILDFCEINSVFEGIFSLNDCIWVIWPNLRLILIRKVVILFESYFSTFWIAFLYFLDCTFVLFGLHFSTFRIVAFWYFSERRILVLFGTSYFSTFRIAF